MLQPCSLSLCFAAPPWGPPWFLVLADAFGSAFYLVILGLNHLALVCGCVFWLWGLFAPCVIVLCENDPPMLLPSLFPAFLSPSFMTSRSPPKFIMVKRNASKHLEMSQHLSYIHLNCLEIFLRTMVDTEYMKYQCTRRKTVLCWANVYLFPQVLIHALIHLSVGTPWGMFEVLCSLQVIMLLHST